jgi:hypothetical protein
VSVPAVESLLFRARTRLRVELKAVTAALSGLVPRLLAGGGAAKVAGVTVAAGLLTGGVVASERRPTHHSIPFPRVASAPHVARVFPDVPAAPVSVSPPAARPAVRPVPHHTQPPRTTPIVFAPSTRAPVPVTDAPHGEDTAASPTPTPTPTASESGDGRAPVVATEDTSNATVPAEDTSSETQQTTPAEQSSDDSSSTAQPDGSGEPAASASDDGADTPGS